MADTEASLPTEEDMEATAAGMDMVDILATEQDTVATVDNMQDTGQDMQDTAQDMAMAQDMVAAEEEETTVALLKDRCTPTDAPA